MKTRVALILGISCLGTSFVYAGAGSSGGGDGYVQNFAVVGFQVHEWLESHGATLVPPVSAKDFLETFESALLKGQIQSTNDPLKWEGVPEDAIYTDDDRITRLIRPRWNPNAIDASKLQLVAHEIFRRMGLPDNLYQLSRQIVIPSARETKSIEPAHLVDTAPTPPSSNTCALLRDSAGRAWNQYVEANKTELENYQQALEIFRKEFPKHKKNYWQRCFGIAADNVSDFMDGLTAEEESVIQLFSAGGAGAPGIAVVSKVFARALERITHDGTYHQGVNNISFQDNSEKELYLYDVYRLIGLNHFHEYYPYDMILYRGSSGEGHPRVIFNYSYLCYAEGVIPFWNQLHGTKIELTGNKAQDKTNALNEIAKEYWSYLAPPPMPATPVYADKTDFMVRHEGLPVECLAN